MHPTDVRPAREPAPAPARTARRRPRGLLALAAALCGLASAGLTYLGLTELTTPSFPPAMTAPAPASVSPAAGTTTAGPARLGAVSWPADGSSAADISGVGPGRRPGARPGRHPAGTDRQRGQADDRLRDPARPSPGRRGTGAGHHG